MLLLFGFSFSVNWLNYVLCWLFEKLGIAKPNHEIASHYGACKALEFLLFCFFCVFLKTQHSQVWVWWIFFPCYFQSSFVFINANLKNQSIFMAQWGREVHKIKPHPYHLFKKQYFLKGQFHSFLIPLKRLTSDENKDKKTSGICVHALNVWLNTFWLSRN